jgi:hypothetical protein
MVFQRYLYNSIPNVTLRRVLRKRLHLKAYKLSIVQGVECLTVCTPLRVNVFVTLTTHNMWSIIVKLFLKLCITSESYIEP